MNFGSIRTPIIPDGLVFNMDAANRASYPRTGTTTTDTVNEIIGTGYTYVFDASNKGILQFDGVDDYITCPNSSVTDPQTNFSLNIWVQISGINRQHGLIENYAWSSGKGNFALRITTGNKLAFYTVVGTSADDILSSATISKDVWYNFCVTQNHDTTTATIYINGVQDNQETDFDIGPATSDITMKIGARGDDRTKRLYGKISCIQMYNRALSSTEVLHNYNALKSRFGL